MATQNITHAEGIQTDLEHLLILVNYILFNLLLASLFNTFDHV